jgi:hypothetical protein
MVQLLSHCFGFDMLAHVMISIGVINRYVYPSWFEIEDGRGERNIVTPRREEKHC